MATNPSCAIVAIFGIQSSKFDCSHKHHHQCGQVVTYNTLVCFKTMAVEVGKSFWEKNANLIFYFSGKNKYATIQAAIWVSGGFDHCVLGRVDPRAWDVQERLEGRLAQVIEIFAESSNKIKKDYNEAHNGVYLCSIVDQYNPGDDVTNEFLDIVDI